MGIDRLFLVAAMTVTLGSGAAPGLAASPLSAWGPAVRCESGAGDGERADRNDDRTPYVAGIVGSSTNAETSLASGGLPMGDAAIGVSVPRPIGAVRLELEGRQRTSLSGDLLFNEPRSETMMIDQEWTTMANVWRDLDLSEHTSLYAGGGVGVGGYRMQNAADSGSRVTDAAWQVGGGATYDVTERVTLDAGYRYYGVGTDRPVGPAGEIVFAVRIADPFRGWLKR